MNLLYGSLNLSPVSSDIGMRQNKFITKDVSVLKQYYDSNQVRLSAASISIL